MYVYENAPRIQDAARTLTHAAWPAGTALGSWLREAGCICPGFRSGCCSAVPSSPLDHRQVLQTLLCCAGTPEAPEAQTAPRDPKTVSLLQYKHTDLTWAYSTETVHTTETTATYNNSNKIHIY